MPTQSEENKQVIQQRYNALVRGDTDTLFASTHKGDPQERDRRVLRNMTFIASICSKASTRRRANCAVILCAATPRVSCPPRAAIRTGFR